LFESPGFFPVSLHLTDFFAFRFAHDVLLLSQKTVRAAFVAGGLPIDKAVVREMQRVLQCSLAR
jgi:hypothetical protein